MKSDRETCCKHTSNDLKNCQKTTRSYPDYAPKQVRDQSKLDNSSMLFRHQEGRKINFYAGNTRYLEMTRKIAQKGGSKAMHDLALSEEFSFEVQVQSLFQDQTVSWIRIVNGIDKFVREAMPIQEEEKGSEKPAAKARPILKPSSIKSCGLCSYWSQKMG